MFELLGEAGCPSIDAIYYSKQSEKMTNGQNQILECLNAVKKSTRMLSLKQDIM